MPSQRYNLILLSLIAIIGMAAAAPITCPAFFECGEKLPSFELYTGPLLIYEGLEGGFNGNTAYTDGSNVIMIPDVQSGLGAAALIGIRMQVVTDNFAALEAGYGYSHHHSSYSGNANQTALQIIKVSAKWSYAFMPRFQVSGRFGLCMPAAETTNAHAVIATPPRHDAVFYGSGMEAGLGTEFRVNDHLSIMAEGFYRTADFNIAEFSGRVAELDPPVASNSMHFSVGVVYHCDLSGLF